MYKRGFEVIDAVNGKPVLRENLAKITETEFNCERPKAAMTQDGEIILIDDEGKYATCHKQDLIIKQTHNKYPDLQWFEINLFANILAIHPEWKDKIKFHNIEAAVFPQTWASTAGGFEAPGMVAGAAITTEYTTVLTLTIYGFNGESNDTVYGVYFGNRPAYLVEDANETFLADLDARNIKSKYEAETAY